jgi:iron complex transport system substrate-binding protein
MVYALGAGDRIVGTDDYSDFPAAAKTHPRVGGVQPNIEKIVALRPDLVVASASSVHPGLERALGAAHIPLEIVKTDRAADVAGGMERLGHRLGIVAASDAAASLRRHLEQQKRVRNPKPRVMFVGYAQPVYVAGRDTFTGDIIELAGAENAATVKGWPPYSTEALIADPPDVVIHPDKSVSRESVVALFARAPRKPEIVGVDENVFSRPGPRIVEAAAALNAILDRWNAER